MYNVSQNFLNTVKQNGRKFRATVVVRDTVFDDNNITEIVLDENVNPDDTFTLGAVGSTKFDVSLMNVPLELITENANITASIGLLTDDAYEDIPLGVFTVDKVNRGNNNLNTVKLTCYDNMIKLEIAFFSNLVYPADINDVVNEICTKTGVVFAGTLPHITINKIEGYSCREAIGFIASFLGGFARFNRHGELEITTYTDSAFAIDKNNYFLPLTTNEKPFVVGKLTCKVGSTVLAAGADGSEIQFENPIMTQEQLNSIYNILKNLSYMPYSMDWTGNQALQAGDKISITDTKGNTFDTLLMNNKITYHGSIKASASAVGKTETAQNFDSGGSMSNKVDKVVIEQANIKVALIDKATIGQLNAQTGRIDTLVSNVASIQTLVAGNLTAANFQAGAITAGSSVIANSAIGSAQISDLDVNKLNAGTLDTAKITVAGANSRLKISGNRLQVFATKADSSLYERVSLGDVNGDGSNYGFRVRGADGTTVLLDETGVKREGITDGSINNAKIGSDASIAGTKLDIESVISSVNGATTQIQGSKVQLTNGSLDVAFNSLTQTVSNKATQTDINNSINNLQIGGRNHLKGTTDVLKSINTTEYSALLSEAGGNYFIPIAALGLKVGDVISFSAYIDASANTTFGGGVRLTFYSDNVGNGKTAFMGNFISAGHYGYSTVTYTLTNLNLYVSIQLQNDKSPTTPTELVKYSKAKIELGNKPTDWSPAPEDVQTQITTNSSNITATAQAIGFDLTSQTLTQTGLNQRLTTAEGSITVQAGQIATKVTQTDINNSINNLQIGGRNLIEQSTFQYTALPASANFTLYRVNNITSSAYTVNGFHYTADAANGAVNSSMGIAINSAALGLKVGDAIAFSSDLKGSFGTSNNGLCIMHATTTNASFYACASVGTPHPTSITDWTRKSRTYTIPSYIKIETDGSFWLYIFWGGGTGSAVDVYVRNVKIELGNKPTDWSPAQEDVQTQIDTHTTQIQQMSNTIALKANQSSLDTTNGNVSSLSGQLTVQAGQIATKVSTSDVINYNNKTIKCRYIRDTVNGSSVDTGDFWLQIKAFVGKTNVALGKTATASFTPTTGVLSAITDGSI